MLNSREKKKLLQSNRTSNLIAFQILFLSILLLTLIFNIIILILFITITPNLKYPVFHWILFELTLFIYIIFIILSFLAIIFSGYELVQFVLFVKDERINEEKPNQRTWGSIGTKFIIKFYIAFIIALIVILKLTALYIDMSNVLNHPEVPDYGAREFIFFYFFFAPLIYSQVFMLGNAHHFLSFSIDHKERKNIIKIILYPTIWMIVLLLIFFFDLRWLTPN